MKAEDPVIFKCNTLVQVCDFMLKLAVYEIIQCSAKTGKRPGIIVKFKWKEFIPAITRKMIFLLVDFVYAKLNEIHIPRK